MKYAILIAVAALCVACTPKNPNDQEHTEKAPEKAPAEKAAPETPPAEKTAETPAAPEKPAAPAPAEPAKPALVVEARSFGGINDQTKYEQKAIEAALPGYTVERHETEAEGDTYVGYTLQLDGKAIGGVSEGHGGGISISFSSKSIKDEKGIGLGSTHSDLIAAWPDAKCDLFVLEQPTDGIEPFKSVDCKIPSAQSLWYRIDVTDMAGIGDEMPEGDAIAKRPISGFTASFPPLGGWK